MFMLGTTVFVVVLLPTPLRSISPVSVTEFVVEEPLCNPVGIVVLCDSEAPKVFCELISTLRYHRHGIVFGPLLDITPVIWSFTLAVLLQVGLVGDQPVIDYVGLFL